MQTKTLRILSENKKHFYVDLRIDFSSLPSRLSKTSSFQERVSWLWKALFFEIEHLDRNEKYTNQCMWTTQLLCSSPATNTSSPIWRFISFGELCFFNFVDQIYQCFCVFFFLTFSFNFEKEYISHPGSFILEKVLLGAAKSMWLPIRDLSSPVLYVWLQVDVVLSHFCETVNGALP